MLNKLKFPLNLQRFAATLSISLKEDRYSVEENTSYVTLTITATRTSGTTHWENLKTGTAIIDGQSFQFNLALKSSQKSSSTTVSTTIKHNDDGSKTISCSASIATGTSSGTISAEGSYPLTSIPRSTDIPSLTGEIENSYTIPIYPNSTDFSHSLYIEFGKINGYVNNNGDLQTSEYKFSSNTKPVLIPFNFPVSFYTVFNIQESMGTMTLKTYSGDKLIGEKQSSLTVRRSESRCRPSIEGTVEDSNPTTINLTGNKKILVNLFSNALIKLTLKAAVSEYDTTSMINSQTIDGAAFGGTEITINNVQKKDFTINVSNFSRYSTTKVISADSFLEYFKPNINLNVERYPDQTSSNIRITYSGTFFNQNFGKVQNTLTMKWYWKKSTDSEWTPGGTITPTIKENQISEKYIDTGDLFDYQTEYRIRLEVIDKLTSDGSKEQLITRGEPIYSHGENWFQFHVDTYDSNDIKFLNYKTMWPVGAVYITATNTNPQTFFPGTTWVSFGSGQCLVGVNANDSDFNTPLKTGGNKNLYSHHHILPGGSRNIYYATGDNVLWVWASLEDTGYSPQTLDTGDGNAGNLPPYITVYFWRRTA